MPRGLLFQAWGSLTSLKYQTRDPWLKGLVLRIYTSWIKSIDLSRVWTREPWVSKLAHPETIEADFLKLCFYHSIQYISVGIHRSLFTSVIVLFFKLINFAFTVYTTNSKNFIMHCVLQFDICSFLFIFFCLLWTLYIINWRRISRLTLRLL